MAEEEEQAASSEQQAEDGGESPEDAPSTESAPENDEAAGDTPREAADEAADVDVDQAPEPDEQAASSEQQAEDQAPEPAAAPTPGPSSEPAVLPPKERRRRARSTHTGESGPPLSVEERIQRREEGRRSKAAERRRYRAGRGAARHTPGTAPEPVEREPGNQKIRQGTVVSDKGDKTITVRVESARRHPAYEKVIRSSKMFHAHDERNEAAPGDVVRLMETRPMSKTKHWRLVEILERAK